MMKKALVLPIFLAGIFAHSCVPSSFAADEPAAPASSAVKVVKAIDVKGNKSVSSLTILAKVQTQIGQPPSSAVLRSEEHTSELQSQR